MVLKYCIVAPGIVAPVPTALVRAVCAVAYLQVRNGLNDPHL